MESAFKAKWPEAHYGPRNAWVEKFASSDAPHTNPKALRPHVLRFLGPNNHVMCFFQPF